MPTAKKKAAPKKKRRSTSKKKATPRRRTNGRSAGFTFADVLMASAGAIIASKIKNTIPVKDDKVKAAMMAGGGLFLAPKVPKQFQPLLFGMAVASTVMLGSALIPNLLDPIKGGPRGIGGISRQEVQMLRDAAARNRGGRMNGRGPVMLGVRAGSRRGGVIMGMRGRGQFT